MMKTSARSAAGPSFEMLRMSARGISGMNWIAIRAFVLNGCRAGLGATAFAKASQFSAVKINPGTYKSKLRQCDGAEYDCAELSA